MSQGGINGRKLNLIQYDDAYSPPKAVEQVRKLVEGDEVLFTFQIIGALERRRPEVPQRKKVPAAARLHRSLAILGSAERALGPSRTIRTTSRKPAFTPSTF